MDGQELPQLRGPGQLPSRLTVVEMVYHRSASEQPTIVDDRWGRDLSSDEQVYRRRMTATERPDYIDRGWIAAASMIHITNEEGRRLTTIPMAIHQVQIAAKVVEVGIILGGAFTVICVVRPGESCRFEPIQLDRLRVRCRQGSAKIMLTLFPE